MSVEQTYCADCLDRHFEVFGGGPDLTFVGGADVFCEGYERPLCGDCLQVGIA